MPEPSPPQTAEQRLSDHEQGFAITTWQYLRLAMVALVVGLAMSIAYERISVHAGCLQNSISAYYYTSVHAYFTAALVAVGVCLFCLKGSTDSEDVLLNLAGMFAPVVGLVPTPDRGTCGVVLGTTEHITGNVANNAFALVGVGALALAIIAAVSLRNRPSAATRYGFAVAAAVWLGGVCVLIFAEHFFVEHAHPVAAGSMFVLIFLVVCINAREYKVNGPAPSVRNRYGVIAVAMGTSFVAFPAAGGLGWHHWVFGIEVALISLFAAFWLIQTHELREQGLR
jgi:hypothetical protein